MNNLLHALLFLLFTLSGFAASQIGQVYGAGDVDPVTHKVLHGVVGGATGALLNGKDGATSGALSAVIAETLADLVTPQAEHIRDTLFQSGCDDPLKAYNDYLTTQKNLLVLTTASIMAGLGQDVDVAIQTADNALSHNWLQSALLAAELGIDEVEENRDAVIEYLKNATDYTESDIAQAVDYLIAGGRLVCKATDLVPGKAAVKTAVKAPTKAVIQGVKGAIKAGKSPVKLPLNDVKSKGAAHFLNKKLRLHQKIQKTAERTVELPDGRIRYYEKEIPSHKPGKTRGRSHVIEHNPKTGQVKAWMENYGHDGKVIRVHPKSNNGQDLKKPHYPLTGKEKGDI